MQQQTWRSGAEERVPAARPSGEASAPQSEILKSLKLKDRAICTERVKGDEESRGRVGVRGQLCEAINEGRKACLKDFTRCLMLALLTSISPNNILKCSTYIKSRLQLKKLRRSKFTFSFTTALVVLLVLLHVSQPLPNSWLLNL